MSKLKVGDKLIVCIGEEELGDIIDNKNSAFAKVSEKLKDTEKLNAYGDIFIDVEIKSISHKVRQTKIKQVKEYVIENNEDDGDWDF